MVEAKTTPRNKKNNVRIIIIGDQAVGKSSLLMRYCEDTFTLNMMGTAGLDFKKKTIDFKDETINVLFYDSAGHDRFRHIVTQHYKGAKGIILTYDITDKNSFINVNDWMKNIKENADSNAEILLLGNKTDLSEERTVNYEEGVELSKKFSVEFYETSAKTGENTSQAFYSLIMRIFNNPLLNADIFQQSLKTENEEKKEENPINLNQKSKNENKKKEGSSCFKCG